MAPYWTPYVQSMPGLCWGIVRHGHQIVRAKSFNLYDYGTKVSWQNKTGRNYSDLH